MSEGGLMNVAWCR